MKKILNSIFAVAAAAVLAVSCNVDAVTTKFDPSTVTGTGVTFLTTVAVDQEIPATQTSYDIVVARANADAAQTVSVSSSLPETIVVPSSVSFGASEYQTKLTLDLSKMAVGQTFKGSIALGVDDAEKQYSNASLSCTFAKAFTWTNIGKGQFLDLFWEGILVDVDIYQAEGFEIYRVMDPYAESEEGDGSGPDYILIQKLDDGKAKFDTYRTPYLYSAGNYVKAYFPSEFSSNYAQYDSASIYVDKYFAFVPVWYVDGVGGWGVNYGYTLFVALPGASQDLYDWYQANFE